MGIASSMKELTKDIVYSSEERDKELSRIKKETSILLQEAVHMVTDFSISRDETSRHLKQELAQSGTDRRKEVMQSLKNAQIIIHSFHNSRQESGRQLRKELTQNSKLLIQNEKNRKQEVKKMLDAIQNSRKEIAAELKKDLSEGKAKMQTEVKATLADASALINGFQSSRHTMGVELKKGLIKGGEDIKTTVKDMGDGFRKIQAEVRADLKEAAVTWKKMSSPTLKKTPAGKVTPKIPVVTPPNMEEELLSRINQHAQGITLSDIANELGIATIVLGKMTKSLLEQGKVRKEGKNYFPVGI